MINRNFAASPNQQPSNTLLESTMAANQQLVAAGKENVAANVDIFERINKAEQTIQEYAQKASSSLADMEYQGRWTNDVTEAKRQLQQELLDATNEASGRNAFSPQAKAKLAQVQNKIATYISTVGSMSKVAENWAKQMQGADPEANIEVTANRSKWDNMISSGAWKVKYDGTLIDTKSGAVLGNALSKMQEYYTPPIEGKDFEKQFETIASIDKASNFTVKGRQVSVDKTTNTAQYEYSLDPNVMAAAISRTAGWAKTSDYAYTKLALRLNGEVTEQERKEALESGDYRGTMSRILAAKYVKSSYPPSVGKPESIYVAPQGAQQSAVDRRAEKSINKMADGWIALSNGDSSRFKLNSRVGNALITRIEKVDVKTKNGIIPSYKLIGKEGKIIAGEKGLSFSDSKDVVLKGDITGADGKSYFKANGDMLKQIYANVSSPDRYQAILDAIDEKEGKKAGNTNVSNTSNSTPQYSPGTQNLITHLEQKLAKAKSENRANDVKILSEKLKNAKEQK